MQGQGPIASALRIIVKLRNKSWLPRFLSSRGTSESTGRRKQDSLRAIKVVDLLTHAAELGNKDALFALAKINMLPPTHHFAQDLPAAYRYFSGHAAETGNATSQAYLAFFHATGYDDVAPVDQAKANLYYTFAAHGGDKGAQMTLGYRYWSGIAVAEDCMSAVRWYELAAEQAMAKFLSGPPGGRTLPLTSTRLSDLDGGVYGPGASVASTGLNVHRPSIKAARARMAGETWEDIVEYYIFNADRGESDYMFRLGKIYYQGSIYSAPGGITSGGEGVGRVPRDYERARYYFERVARSVWPTDPLDPLQHRDHGRREDAQQHVGYATAAAGYLGRMYLRGEGVRQDFKRARMWFERGADHMDKECHNGLGIIWRDGLVGNKKDPKKAITHFMAAAGQELPEAQVNLGKFHYNKGDIKSATAYFEAALRHGSPFEAYYYLAQIHARSLVSLPPSMHPGACSMATSFFKVVAERGSWGDNLLAAGETAWNRGAQASALLLWSLAAERGHEMGQNNVAYVLDPDRSMFLRGTTPTDSEAARRALTQWTRSAAQNNVDALVKVADYYFYGVGIDEPAAVRYEKAAGYYRSAVDTQVSALAMWNLGWMYENGVGVPQDFHLAKRYYDVALETNQEAYLPVTLALFKLYARSIWHTLMGGTGGLNLWAPDEEACAY
ncbi:HCP-like protein [Vararia minispora EC-137]|uniref:HCP-like protein n=1 Tax=Vararia minispora EC-137 TaxID=1314806 RepID=A0ACB8QSM2_9AGAM|nr:HCP-like protein [Vararia minispora EC-137]